MSYKRTLVAICAIITLSSMSCAVDSVPGVTGTIFRFDYKTTYAYTPSSGATYDLALERDGLSPYIACRGPGDTILCIIKSGIAKNFYSNGELYGTRTVGKYVPFESRFELVPSLADTSFGVGWLSYDPDSNNYLFGGRPGGEQKGAYYVLNTEFDVVSELSSIISGLLPENKKSISGMYSLANGNILFGKLGDRRERAVFELDTIRQACTKISSGIVRAVSPTRNLAIITEQFRTVQLYNTHDKSWIRLGIVEKNTLAFCFSPDERYIAYSVRENNFRNTIRLHIYDLVERKDYETAPIGVGPLLWLPIEPPAEFLKTAKKY